MEVIERTSSASQSVALVLKPGWRECSKRFQAAELPLAKPCLHMRGTPVPLQIQATTSDLVRHWLVCLRFCTLVTVLQPAPVIYRQSSLSPLFTRWLWSMHDLLRLKAAPMRLVVPLENARGSFQVRQVCVLDASCI